MKYPRVSILIPVYNGAHYLAETLDTVVKQTFTDWEIVLMDGGSKDNTVAIAEQYAALHPNIHIFSEPDEGPYHAIHKALRRANGEFIFILCASDGYLEDKWLELCIVAMEQDQQISLVWGIPFDITEEGKLIGPHFAYAHFMQGAKTRGPFIKEILKRLTKPSSLARLIRKINISNLSTVKRVIKAEKLPCKQDWFRYWLETGMIFPDGNMCVARRVFEECLPPYTPGTREAGDWMRFFFNVNSKGYLSVGLPIPANFTRREQKGSVTSRVVAYNDEKRRIYFRELAAFRKKIISGVSRTITFRDRAGNVIS